MSAPPAFIKKPAQAIRNLLYENEVPGMFFTEKHFGERSRDGVSEGRLFPGL